MENQMYQNIYLRANANKKDVYRAVLGKIALVTEKQISLGNFKRTFKNEMVECAECGMGYKTEMCPFCHIQMILEICKVDTPTKTVLFR